MSVCTPKKLDSLKIEMEDRTNLLIIQHVMTYDNTSCNNIIYLYPNGPSLFLFILYPACFFERPVCSIDGSRLGIVEFGHTSTKNGPSAGSARKRYFTERADRIVATNHISEFGFAANVLEILCDIVNLWNHISSWNDILGKERNRQGQKNEQSGTNQNFNSTTFTLVSYVQMFCYPNLPS